MKITISNIIIIEDPTKEIKDYCKQNLVVKNPQFDKLKRMGYYAYGTPKEIRLYDAVDNKIYVPIGCFNDIYKIHPVSSDYIDYTASIPINIKSDIKLRDYQKPCPIAIKKYYNGILNMPCGTGKTMSALACIAEVKQKTLWLAHTIDLVNQAKSSCENTMTCKTSLITEGKCDKNGDIVFGTVQTVLKFIENGELKQDDFGMIVVDECQHVSTNPNSIQMFRTCFEYFAARYKCGLTATIHRSDGLEGCLLKIIGEPIYKIEQRKNEYVCVYENTDILKFPVDKFQVPANIIVQKTNYSIWDKDVFDANGGTVIYSRMISDIAMNKERNNQILKDLRNVKGSTIILSDRVDQLKQLNKYVENGVQIDGSTPKKVRVKALDDVRSGKIKYLFASYQLAKEGLDCPILENLFLLTPIKDFTVVVQSIGRIQRLYGNKSKATVYDYVDDVGQLMLFYTKRRAIYRKHGWKIENGCAI